MKPSSSLRWLTLALLVPLLVLGILAWLGTRAQVRAAWSSARDEAKVAGEIAAQTLARELAEAVEAVPVFPDPPVPGARSAADDVLDNGELAALRGLRDDAEAGISPAGLPRRVLAAFRVYEMSQDAADGAALLEISTRDAPSVLTPMAIEKLGELAGDWPQRWARGERAREVFRRHGAGWISAEDGKWWLEPGADGLRAVSPEALERALAESARFLPAWAGLRYMGMAAAEGRRPSQSAPGSAIPPGAQPMGSERDVAEEVVPSSNGVSSAPHGRAASARPRHLGAAEAQPMGSERDVAEEVVPSSNGVSFAPHGRAASARPRHLGAAEAQPIGGERDVAEEVVPSSNGVSFAPHGRAASARPRHLGAAEAQPIGGERDVVEKVGPSSKGDTFAPHGHAASARPRHLGAAEVLASVPVKFGTGETLEIIAARPALVEAAARQQARWTLGLLAFAVAISGGALWLIHRAVARERRLNALKSDFVASVSHELRAPVASIRLMADALGAGKIEARTVAEFHGLISREGARLSALIENVLDFARIEQGRKRWDFETAELAPLVRETLDLMTPLAAEKSIRLVAADPLPEVTATIDPGAIRQALVNLLDNAIKFSPPDSTVEISLAANAADWRIAISDKGPGIAAAEHARIFERFYRLGGELRRETQGTGIGLSLVKAVAVAHGGRVLLESAPGEGCVFTLIGPIRPIS